MTDISEPLLGVAKAALADPRVTFLPADACQLPFPDKSFEAHFCQYGVMFFPDKVEAMEEARPALASAVACIFRLLRSATSL